MSERLQIMKELVTEEAMNIKIHATPEEIAGLDRDNLFPYNPNKCIYGQMTGDCYSARANELIVKCCSKVYNSTGHDVADAQLNGEPYIVDRKQSGIRGNKFFSPIEVLITQNFKKELSWDRTFGLKIIDFLKGETSELNL